LQAGGLKYHDDSLRFRFNVVANICPRRQMVVALGLSSELTIEERAKLSFLLT